MNHDDILRMAREASGGMLSYDSEGQWRLNEVEAQRFAALVAAAEREACAVIAENGLIGHTIAKAIRARGEK